MELRQLAYVVAVVDHGGFTRAAAEVHVAQPSLSQAVRALERELGVELFHRLGRRVVLSAAGEALLGPARQALRSVEIARAAVSAVTGLERGHLDLVALPTLAVDPTAALVGSFRAAHPDVIVRLAEPDAPGPLVAADTLFMEPMGADTLGWFQLGAQRLSARLSPQRARGVSGPVQLALDLQHASLFDRNSEQRL